MAHAIELTAEPIRITAAIIYNCSGQWPTAIFIFTILTACFAGTFGYGFCFFDLHCGNRFGRNRLLLMGTAINLPSEAF
ncbi:hypothetical protein EGS38_01670 [Neisseria chenwenguii]|nr:hypothetical protein EGS38_01670 [Neisseria chenwenguii]